MLEKLKSIVGENNVRENESMAGHSTFRAGGECKYFIEVSDTKVLKELISCLNAEKKQYMIIGNGSNILVKDSGYDGIVIHLSGEEFNDVTMEEMSDKRLKVTAGSAAMLGAMCKKAGKSGYTGTEGLAGIPGTIGGAVVMNAGAYGQEIKDIISECICMKKNGETVTLSKEELDLSYRHSIICEEELIVLKAVFILEKGDLEKIEAKMKECAQLRKEKQPLEYPSAGSTFKRPQGYFAGKLIMDAGLRGYTVGGAMVSEKHCGFVINANNATATDILQLMEDVKNKVENKFGVELEPEVKIIG